MNNTTSINTVNNVYSIDKGKKKYPQYESPRAGIVQYRYVNGEIEILMIQNKISFGYSIIFDTIEPIRMRYFTNMYKEELKLFSKMTQSDFKLLSEEHAIKYPGCKTRYHSIKDSDKDLSDTLDLIKKYSTEILNKIKKGGQEKIFWRLPKGQVEEGETIIQAACREHLEETSVIIRPDEIKNINPIIIENFYGHIHYFLVYCPDRNPINNFNNEEVSNVKWIVLNKSIYKHISKHTKYTLSILERRINFSNRNYVKSCKKVNKRISLRKSVEVYA